MSSRTSAQQHEPAEVEIHARNVEFDWENVPLESLDRIAGSAGSVAARPGS